MTTLRLRLGAISLMLALTLMTVPVTAQFVVYDPANYLEAILQYEQILRHYEFLIQQAKRLPVDMASRYHAHSIDWTYHDLRAGLQYAQPLLAALNEGDVTGAAYRGAITPLDLPNDVVGRMPAEMRRRFASAYSTVELADSISRLAIDQSGAARVEGPFSLQAAKNIEHDAVNTGDDFQTQTALLEKMGAALAIELRLGAQTNQFQVSALEQMILDNKRKRDAEATLLNATMHQWRYGQAYGDDLFSRTAANIDTWRPY